jgi:hypothetical protein
VSLQEVWYQLSFEGFPESEAEWFPASRIRAEHPQGEELIAAFDRGLEATGQGDVALPPHAAERAAALSVGTPQVREQGGLWRCCDGWGAFGASGVLSGVKAAATMPAGCSMWGCLQVCQAYRVLQNVYVAPACVRAAVHAAAIYWCVVCGAAVLLTGE